MANVQLTAGAALHLMSNVNTDLAASGYHPVMQVIELRRIQPRPGGNEVRVKLILSDGTHFLAGMLTSQLVHMVETRAILLNSVIQITQYAIQNINVNRTEEKGTIVVMMGVTVLEHAQARIDNPVQAVLSGNAGAAHVKPDPSQAAYGAPAQHTSAYGAPAQPPMGGYEAPQAATGAYGAPPGAPPGAYNGAPQASPYGQQAAAASTYGNNQWQAPGGQHGGAMAGGGMSNPYGAPAAGGYGGAYGAPASNPYGAPASNPYGASIPSRYDNRGGAVVRNTAPTHYTQIKDISPYIARWTIKGRVTSKGELRRYNKNGQEGCVFNFDMSDASGEVRVVAFKEVAEKFFDRVQMGACYTLSKASAKPMDAGKRKWNQTGHDCEVYLDNHSELEEAQEDAMTAALPRVHVKLIQIAHIQELQAGEVIDIMGVLERCDDWGSITRRDGTEARKRSFVLADDSGRSIEVTLWGDKVDNPGGTLYEAAKAGQHPVVCIKSARVGDFNGKTLSTIGSSTVLVDPEDLDGVERLRSWFAGGNHATQALSVPGKGGRADRRVTLAMIKDEGMGHGNPAWVKVLATVMSIRTEPMTYPACWEDYNGRKCQKKMTENNDDSGQFYCERCGVSGQPKYRYLLQTSFGDFTSSLDNVNVFGELGEAVVGIPAEEAHEVEVANRNGDESRQEALLSRVLYRLKAFKIKVHEDNYNDETRVKHTLAGCEDADFVAESRTLINMIEDMQSGRPIAVMQPPPSQANAAGPAPGQWGSPPPVAAGYNAAGAGNPYGSMQQQPAYGGYNTQAAPAQPGMQGGYGNAGGAPPAYGGYDQPQQAAPPAAFLNQSFL